MDVWAKSISFNGVGFVLVVYELIVNYKNWIFYFNVIPSLIIVIIGLLTWSHIEANGSCV